MNPTEKPDEQIRSSIPEWRANRAARPNTEATKPAIAPVSAPEPSLADLIRTRRGTTPTSAGEGEGSSGGDEGQQQTVARTPLFASLGFKLKNAGQDIPTPAPKYDPMSQPAEDMGSALSAPTPKRTTKRKLGR